LAVVLLPGLLAAENGGRKQAEVDAATVREALQALPIRNLVLDEHGGLRPLVNLYVDGQPAALETELDERSELRLVAAVAGGRPLALSD
jgi:molybdopterin converting factor small subunit